MTVKYCWFAAGLVALTGCSGGGSDDGFVTPPPPAPWDGPVVSAHRGGAAYGPENTMRAFANAIRLGVDQLEADTQLSADGVLVLIHDDTLDRTTDCSGTVLSRNFLDLQTCDAAHWFSPGQPVTAPNDNLPHPLRA